MADADGPPADEVPVEEADDRASNNEEDAEENEETPARQDPQEDVEKLLQQAAEEMNPQIERVALSEEDIREFREIFNLVDTDGSGAIDSDELQVLVESVGVTFG